MSMALGIQTRMTPPTGNGWGRDTGTFTAATDAADNPRHDKPQRHAAMAPRPTECFQDGEAAPRRKRPDNGVATMGRGQWHNTQDQRRRSRPLHPLVL